MLCCRFHSMGQEIFQLWVKLSYEVQPPTAKCVNQVDPVQAFQSRDLVLPVEECSDARLILRLFASKMVHQQMHCIVEWQKMTAIGWGKYKFYLWFSSMQREVTTKDGLRIGNHLCSSHHLWHQTVQGGAGGHWRAGTPSPPHQQTFFSHARSNRNANMRCGYIFQLKFVFLTLALYRSG